MLKAAKYQPVIWSVDDLEDIDIKQLGLKGSPTIVSKVWAPPPPEGGTMIEGKPLEQVEQLLSVILEKKELFTVKEGI
jgi:electron transfer flavoprotein beta subunit